MISKDGDAPAAAVTPAAIDAVYRRVPPRACHAHPPAGRFRPPGGGLHDAFTAALAPWPGDGMPDNACAWLVSAGRGNRHDPPPRRFDASLAEIANQLDSEGAAAPDRDDEGIEDDRLRLIFTCCHPALSTDARIALTLREVCAYTELPERLDIVLQVVYLVFNEDYYASSGESLTRSDLSGEAIRVGRLLVQLLRERKAWDCSR